MMTANGVGRLVKDPELRKVSLGGKEVSVCDFSLAVNEYRRSNGESKKITHFFDFTVWDSGAENLTNRAKKGDKLYFEASPRQDKFTDKDGNNRSKIVFRLNRFDISPKSVGFDNQKENEDDSLENKSDGAPF